MDTEALYAPYADERYGEFSSRLTRIHDLPYAGVRIPVLRKLAKEIDDISFPVRFHEDVLLRGFWIASRPIPFIGKEDLLRSHFQYLMTWDEADTLAASIKLRKGDDEEAYAFFTSLLSDTRTMVRRFGIVSLMTHRKCFQDRKDEMLGMITEADSSEYYISMAVAWALSFFFIDDPGTEAWLDKVSPATAQRARQKIRDSRRT